MNITFDALGPGERALFEEALTGHTLTFIDSPIRAMRDELRETEILSIFVSSSVTHDMIASMPHLKAIITRSMGFDHIDALATKERSIAVQYVPSYGVHTVAEFAFALILELSRKAHRASHQLRAEGTVNVADFEGFDLAGKTIGVIGTGKIGKSMVRIAKGLDMRVRICDTYPDEAFAKEMGLSYGTTEEVVAESDIVSLHVPLLPETTHLVNEALLAKFKRGSYLINTARGGVVDTNALVKALQNGILAGAGLDVVEGERALLDETSLLDEKSHEKQEYQQLVAAQILLDMPNVVVTPHMAFNSREARREIVDITIKNIQSAIAGTPQNTVK